MIIHKKYKIIQLIDKGGFSKVYLAQHQITNEYVAIKMEKLSTKLPALKQEAQLYLLLKNKKLNITPSFKSWGRNEKYSYLIIEFLHENLHNAYKKKQNINAISLLGIKMLKLLAILHDNGIIHRDIKPSNFLLNSKKELKIIDFGLSKLFEIDSHHIPMKTGHKLIGTCKYASVNIHDGIEYSRRDDLESMIYTLIELYKGYLPWSYCMCDKKEDTYKLINNVKKNVSMYKFCGEEAYMFGDILKYIRSLDFDAKPNYLWIEEKLNENINY